MCTAMYAMRHPGTKLKVPPGYAGAKAVAALFRRHGIKVRAYGNQVRGYAAGILWSFEVL